MPEKVAGSSRVRWVSMQAARGVSCVGEGGEEAVAVLVDDDAAVGATDALEEGAVLLEEGHVVVAEAVEEARGALDVGHDEGDDAGGQDDVRLWRFGLG